MAKSTIGAYANTGHAQEGYRDICGRCGARRVDDQIGLEETPDAYVAKLVEVFREVRRVLRDDGTLWLNLGDTFLGKQLQGIPWRVALALQADGWWLRSDIIWHRPNSLPESVRDRPTKAHEYIFLLSKSKKYFYDADAVREQATTNLESKTLARGSQGYAAASAGSNGSAQRGNINGYGYSGSGQRNRRSVWTVTTKPFNGAKLLADYVGDDGKPYIASPDCPIHGHLARSRKTYTAGYGEQPYTCTCRICKVDHFATYPPDLIEPCILAGTSAKGECSVCGAPWVRVVERKAAAYNEKEAEQQQVRCAGAISGGTEKVTLGRTHLVERKDVGWQPSCTCNADIVPQTVLDPFAGSGTTGMVAVQHGRSFVGIELNPDYLEMAKRRIEQAAMQLSLLETASA